MDQDTPIEFWRSKQFKWIAFIFGGILSILVGLYLTLVSFNYSVLGQNLTRQEASEIVSHLDEQGINYRLADEGTKILVQSKDAMSTRLELVKIGSPLSTTTGFEIFNESNMGSTEFDQKIKLQRALQGELSRSIMMIRGVNDARVLLALPERTLFRSEQVEARASVTIEMSKGERLSRETIAGIQTMVGASVPSLPMENVVVLDEFGNVISARAEPQTAVDTSTLVEPIASTLLEPAVDLSSQATQTAGDTADGNLVTAASAETGEQNLAASGGGGDAEGPTSSNQTSVPARNAATPGLGLDLIRIALIAGAAMFMIIACLIYLFRRRTKGSLNKDERAEFARMLEAELNSKLGVINVAA